MKYSLFGKVEQKKDGFQSVLYPEICMNSSLGASRIPRLMGFSLLGMHPMFVIKDKMYYCNVILWFHDRNKIKITILWFQNH
jgi:hypothetical protein